MKITLKAVTTFEGHEGIGLNCDHLVDTAFDALEQEKTMKKLSKKMITCFLWGNKDFKGSYHEVNFKKPLSEVPTNVLQDYYNRYAKNLQEGQIFWNTNFAELGINTLQKVN